MNPAIVTGSSKKGSGRTFADRMQETRTRLAAAMRRPLLPSGPIPSTGTNSGAATLPPSGTAKSSKGIRKTKSGGLKGVKARLKTSSSSLSREVKSAEDEKLVPLSLRDSFNTADQSINRRSGETEGQKSFAAASVAVPRSETVRNISFLPRNGQGAAEARRRAAAGALVVTAAMVGAISDHSDYAIEYTVHSRSPGENSLKVTVALSHEQLDIFLDDQRSHARDSLWLLVRARLEQAFQDNLDADDDPLSHLLALAQAAEVTLVPSTT